MSETNAMLPGNSPSSPQGWQRRHAPDDQPSHSEAAQTLRPVLEPWPTPPPNPRWSPLSARSPPRADYRYRRGMGGDLADKGDHRGFGGGVGQGSSTGRRV